MYEMKKSLCMGLNLLIKIRLFIKSFTAIIAYESIFPGMNGHVIRESSVSENGLEE